VTYIKIALFEVVVALENMRFLVEWPYVWTDILTCSDLAQECHLGISCPRSGSVIFCLLNYVAKFCMIYFSF
jgi:hypothetical protein